MWFELVRPVTGDRQQKQGIYKRYKSTFNVSRILLDVHLAITTMCHSLARIQPLDWVFAILSSFLLVNSLDLECKLSFILKKNSTRQIQSCPYRSLQECKEK